MKYNINLHIFLWNYTWNVDIILNKHDKFYLFHYGEYYTNTTNVQKKYTA